MKKSKLLFALIILFTVFAFSSCTNFEEDSEFFKNAETQAVEKTMRR